MASRIFYGVLGVVLCTALVVGMLLSELRTGPGLPTGELEFAGLEGAVEVIWDSVGVPHVYATTDRDALFAQGYLHATHRLWQVEMYRRMAQGRLSELFGAETIETDRFLRTLGMRRSAEASVEMLGDEARGLLEGYVEGLNAAVAGWEGMLPPEFVILGFQPEPFTVADVLAIEKIMAFDLADYESSLNLAEAHALLGTEGFERIRPGYPREGMTILQSAGLEDVPGSEGGSAGDSMAESAAPMPPPLPPAADAGEADRLALIEAARRPGGILASVGAVRASNAWVVGPQRSASGKPLVANDMHLSLDRPNLWYLVRLHAPSLKVAGMSLPGTPGVVAGRTESLAWGFTNAMLDDTDLFLERLDPTDHSRYLVPGGSESFEVRTEVIDVRGEAADTLQVRSTRHGPVIAEVESRTGGELIALRWVALDPSTSASALLSMNRAGTVEEFLEALEGFSDPHQNVVFADTSGAWGYWMAGRIPRRASVRPPLTPVPGWTGKWDWEGYLPFDEHPHALAPPSGFVATANNRQARGEIGDRISGGNWASPYRAQRITDLLAVRTDHDIESLHAIQFDVTSLLATRYLDLAARAFAQAGGQAEAEIVSVWDASADPESHAATLFHAWYEAVGTELRTEVYGEPRGYLSHRAVLSALEGGEVDERLVRAARSVIGGDRLPWGEVHRLTLDHPLAQVPLLQTLFGFAEREIPRAGTPHTVNVAEYGYDGDGRFRVRTGPSQRHVTDLADLDSGGFVIPGGQSGYPGGKHSFDQFRIWNEGGLVPVPMSRAGAEARSVGLLRLVPLPN